MGESPLSFLIPNINVFQPGWQGQRHKERRGEGRLRWRIVRRRQMLSGGCWSTGTASVDLASWTWLLSRVCLAAWAQLHCPLFPALHLTLFPSSLFRHLFTSLHFPVTFLTGYEATLSSPRCVLFFSRAMIHRHSSGINTAFVETQHGID